jgi:hypothetical protein
MEYPSIEIYLSSEYSQKATPFCDDCTWTFERELTAPEGYQMYIRVVSFICPISWFVVSVHTNTIVIGGISFSVPEGNYSISQLCKAISVLASGVVFTFDSITHKVTMTSSAFTTLSGPMLVLLGIQPGAGVELVSQQSCDMSGNNSISIECDYNSAFPNIDARQLGSSGLLTRIPVCGSSGGVINFQNFSGRDGLLISERTLTRCRLQLTDEDRRPLRATLDWDLTLQVVFVKSYDTRLRLALPQTLRGEQ